MTLKQRCTSPPPPTRRQGAGAAAIRGVGGPTARSTCRPLWPNSRDGYANTGWRSTPRKQQSSTAAGGGTFIIGGKAVACRPFGEVITALGSPITFGEQVAAIVTEMNHSARRAFHKHAHLLCAPTALEERIRLHQTLVRGAAMWGAESWQNTAAMFKAANSTQTAQVRRMMHPGRRPGESWEDWNVRTLRAARLAIHRACPGGAHTHWSACGTCTGTWHAQSKGGDRCCPGRTCSGGDENRASRAANGTPMQDNSTPLWTQSGSSQRWLATHGKRWQETQQFGGHCGGNSYSSSTYRGAQASKAVWKTWFRTSQQQAGEAAQCE